MPRIQTLHPDPAKKGRSIDAGVYETVKGLVLEMVDRYPGTPFMELTERAKAHYPTFEGNLPWYFITVSLDLEARGVLQRDPSARRVVLRRVGPSAGNA